MKRKHVQFIVSLAVTAFFLYLAFRNVEMAKLWQALRGVRYLWAIPFMVVTIVSMYFRTVRWKYLLEPVVDVPSRNLFAPTMICFALNSVLPGRAGEFARAYLVAKDHKVPFSATFATVVVERIADGLGLLAFFVAILAVVPLGRGLDQKWGPQTMEGASLILWLSVSLVVLSLAVAAFALAVLKASQPRETPAQGFMGLLAKIRRPRAVAATLFVLTAIGLLGVGLLASGRLIQADKIYTFGREYTVNAETLRALSKKLLVICVILLAGTLLMLWEPFHRLVSRVISAVPFVPARLKASVNRIIDSFVQGFYSLRNFRIVFWVVFHTATVWITVGYSLVLMAKGFPGLEMSFMDGMATSIIICIAILIPAAPGYWGLYEIGTILALVMLGLVPVEPGTGLPTDEGAALALSYALVAHFIQMLPILILGYWYLWRRQVNLADLTAAEPV